MTVRIDLKSALIGLLVGVFVLLVLGTGFAGRDVETYKLNVISVGDEVVFTRTNTTTGQVEMWRYLVTQIPYRRDSTVLHEPKY
jgi:hypothetical protein